MFVYALAPGPVSAEATAAADDVRVNISFLERGAVAGRAFLPLLLQLLVFFTEINLVSAQLHRL